MHWRKKRLLSSCLYAIVKANFAKAKRIASAGADIIQLRDKDASDKKLLIVARKLSSLCKREKILFVVNDRVDIALASGADGVHLGQEDLPVHEARKITPRDFLIGVSTHSPKQALQAQEDGADYIGFGPIFATKTKPHLLPVGLEGIAVLNKKIKIPYFVIGNVNLENLKSLKKKGVKRVALHSAVYESNEPEREIALFKKQLLYKII